MTPHPTVTIGGTTIGGTNPVYVIAEAGVNHNGDIATALKLIDAAHAAGADAVKFQLFSADRLVSPHAPLCAYQQQHDPHTETQHEMLKRLELDAAVFAKLAAHASRLGIHFLATPFGVQEVMLLVELKVPAIKIASPDLVNVPLLEAAAATGLPLIVSTGAAAMTEVDLATKLIRSSAGRERLILFHCVSAYPTNPEDAHLRRMRTLADRFGVPVGFSDHTANAEFSALAVAAGAAILEKHLTLDRSAKGPDHFFSLTPDQFSRYVLEARRSSAALGGDKTEISPAELEVRELARASIVAARAIPAGRIITPDCLTVRRPGTGISPASWHDVLGRKATADIPAETILTWAMLSQSGASGERPCMT